MRGVKTGGLERRLRAGVCASGGEGAGCESVE